MSKFGAFNAYGVFQSTFRPTATIVILITGAMLCACSSTPEPTGGDLEQRYLAAVKDAETAEPGEISTDLTAIVPYNENITWSDDGSRVLVVTWTSWDGYDSLVGNTAVLQREVWVTVAPELRNFCQNCCQDNESLILRLEQLLGLPPDSGKNRIIEIWASPNDLFRPSADPEVTDHEAEIDFPISSEFVTINQTHIDWFNTLKKESYGEDGYPWTRLGYTYDWGRSQSEVGLSEFVIREGAAVEIESVSATAEYCR